MISVVTRGASVADAGAMSSARAAGSASAPRRGDRDGGGLGLPGAAHRDALVRRIEHDEHAARRRARSRWRRRSARRGAPAPAGGRRGSRRPSGSAPRPTTCSPGQVRDVREPAERQQVVLADRTEVDVAQHHRARRQRVGRRAARDRDRVRQGCRRHPHRRPRRTPRTPRHTRWGSAQPRPGGVLADRGEQFPHERGDALRSTATGRAYAVAGRA